MDIEETNSATPATAKYISARKNEPVACTIKPTMMGVEIPPMLPPRFMSPPRNPARSRVARMDGTTQYTPHQRRKNSVLESSTTTRTGSLTCETAKMEIVATIAATPNKVR